MSHHSYLATEQRSGLSLVFADRPPRLLRADAVVSDHDGGAQLAVRHLLEAGHKRIGFLGDFSQIQTAADRFAGYAKALSAAGIELDDELIRRDLHNTASAEAAARELIAGPRPTALFPTQNLIQSGSSAPCAQQACTSRSRSSGSTTSRSRTCCSPRSA